MREQKEVEVREDLDCSSVHSLNCVATFSPKRDARVGRNISLIKRGNEEKETRQTLLERSGHDADVTVNVLA
jgi:hypothetical protein